MIGIKHHAFDFYKTRYGETPTILEENIRQGHLLNDMGFFHLEGLLQTWKKNRTTIDREHKTVSLRQEGRSTQTVAYDHLVEGQVEIPNLPPIVYICNKNDGHKHVYQHRYRKTLYGVVPSQLHHNIFFLGFHAPVHRRSCQRK